MLRGQIVERSFVEHAPARDLAFCDGVISDAFDVGLITRGTRGQTLVAAVFPEATSGSGDT